MNDDIVLELVTDDDDPEATERMALALRRELLDIPEVEDVAAAPGGPPPEGARGVDMAAVGALVVSALPTVEVLTKVLGLVRGWLPRSGGATMKVTVNGHTIELRPTKEQQAALVERFIQEASRPAAEDEAVEQG